MNKVHECKIKKLLASFDLEELAISSRFKIRSSGKITAINFLTSFFKLIITKCYSQRQWAICLSNISNESITFQAIAKRLNTRSLSFVKAVIAQAILKNASLQSCIQQNNSLSQFNRVLIEDSTCIKLPKALFPEFPGSKNQFGKDVAVARIQLCVDIKNGDYINYEAQSYRNNDHSYAENIIKLLKPKDLVIRDLGYCSNDIFKKITEKNAYYIARLKPNNLIYSVDNEDLVDLAQSLKHIESKGLKYFEEVYLIGTNNKLKCRVICTKLSQAQIQKRLKQRKKGKSRNIEMNKKKKYLLSWNILITNIDKQHYDGQKIFQLYSLRWHIELIFKTWKSYFKLDSIFKSCQGPDKVKPEILLYLCLCFIVLIVNPQFKKYQGIIYSKFGKLLSPMKFAKTIVNNLSYFLGQITKLKLELLCKNSSYDIRKDRINIYEKILYI